MATGKPRIFELAKELGMSSKELLELFGRLGLEATNQLSVVEPKVADLLRAQLKGARAAPLRAVVPPANPRPVPIPRPFEARTSSLPAPLRSLRVDGWRQFHGVAIDFHDRLTIITGANGAGKTTLLNLIAPHFGWKIPLATVPAAAQAVVQYATSVWTKLLSIMRRQSATRPTMIAIGTLLYDRGETEILVPEETTENTYEILYSSSRAVKGLSIPSHRPVYVPTSVKASSSPITRGDAFVRYTNAVRTTWMPGVKSIQSPLQVLKQTLLSWMGESRLSPDRDLFVAKLAIVLPESLRFSELIARGDEIVLHTGTGEFTLDSVSGGIAALIDLTWQIFTYDTRPGERFVVLIDEPENHLHPELQRSVLRKLTKAFSNAQFIVASHAPLVVTSVEDATVYALAYHADAGTAEAARWVVIARRLSGFDRAGTANDVLREVLGLEYSMPVWAADIIEHAVNEVASAGYTEGAFANLDQTLAKNSLDRYAPSAVAALRKRAGRDAS